MACTCPSTKRAKSYLGQGLQDYGGVIGDTVTNSAISLGRGLARNWFGVGDYTINANSLLGNIRNASNGTPTIMTQQRSTRIIFREYIGDITTSSTAGPPQPFNSVTYKVNPGDYNTFPWLASIANQYEQYKCHGLIFEFRSTTTDSSATGSFGSVMCSSDYDVFDPTPTNKREMLTMAYSSEAKAADNMLHGLECDPNELQRRVFYVRNSHNTADVETDLRDYDICNTTWATEGGDLPASSSIGSLYVHYDFEFFKEQVNQEVAALHTWSGFYRYGRFGTHDAVSSVNIDSWNNYLVDTGENGVAFTDFQQFGKDLGITWTWNTLTFPQTFKGKTLLIEYQASMDVGGHLFDNGSQPTASTFVNCFQDNTCFYIGPMSTKPEKAGTNSPNGPWFQLPDEVSATKTYNMYGRMLLHFNQQWQGSSASVTFAGATPASDSGLPKLNSLATTTNVDISSFVTFTIVPADYLSVRT